MKLKTILLSLLLLLSTSVFAETVCVEKDSEIRSGIVYMPNEASGFSGKSLCLYEDGQIENEETYKDGKVISSTRYEYYESGELESQESRHYKDGKQDGKWTGWHENGQKHYEGNHKDGKKDGKWSWWYESGQIQIESNYRDGKEDGKRTQWHEDGTIEKVENYENGELVD